MKMEGRRVGGWVGQVGDEDGRKESITAWHAAAACQPFDLTKPRLDHRNYLNPHSFAAYQPSQQECLRARAQIPLCARVCSSISLNRVAEWCRDRDRLNLPGQ